MTEPVYRITTHDGFDVGQGHSDVVVRSVPSRQALDVVMLGDLEDDVRFARDDIRHSQRLLRWACALLMTGNALCSAIVWFGSWILGPGLLLTAAGLFLVGCFFSAVDSGPGRGTGPRDRLRRAERDYNKALRRLSMEGS